MARIERCPNCGAPVPHPQQGETASCPYCACPVSCRPQARPGLLPSKVAGQPSWVVPGLLAGVVLAFGLILVAVTASRSFLRVPAGSRRVLAAPSPSTPGNPEPTPPKLTRLAELDPKADFKTASQWVVRELPQAIANQQRQEYTLRISHPLIKSATLHWDAGRLASATLRFDAARLGADSMFVLCLGSQLGTAPASNTPSVYHWSARENRPALEVTHEIQVTNGAETTAAGWRELLHALSRCP